MRCHQVRTVEVDGYKALQLGFDDKKAKSSNKALDGHFKKAGTTAKKKVVEFVDFTISRENTVASENNIYHLPKIVSNGKHKGEDTYIRRENLTICHLVVSYTELKEVGDAVAVNPMDAAMSTDNKADSLFKEEAQVPSEDWAASLGAKN